MYTRRTAVWLLIALVGFAAVYAAFRLTQLARDPNVVLLVPRGQAEWIGVDDPFVGGIHPAGNTIASFRTTFRVSAVPERAIVTVRALKSAAVYLDEQLVLRPRKDTADWKSGFQVDLTDRLSPGDHKLTVTVLNLNGPAAVLAHCETLQLASNSKWEASRDGTRWAPALALTEPQLPWLARKFPRADQAIIDHMPILAPIFAIVFFLSLAVQRPGPRSAIHRLVTSPGGIRWLLILAWVVLAANNFGKLPRRVGFDIGGHTDYIEYVAEHGRIPLASDGWQMFQAPLYYILTTPLYKLLSAFLPEQTRWVWHLLRLVSHLCGALQIEICYRTLKHICPTREDLQMIGTVLGGLLPMNIYLSQAIGNEPLAGCLTAVVVMLAIKSLCVPVDSLSKWHWCLLGLFLGFAILTKVTAVLLVPLVGMVVVYCFARAGAGLKRTAVGCVSVLGIAMIVSAWFYVRNWIELGTPFVGGWDPGRGIVWWQDPGYRVPNHFLAFGQSLIYPVYSGVCGIWDAMFSTIWLDGWLSSVCVYELRPPWNYTAMISGAWLAVLPALGLVIGTGSALCCPTRVARGGLRFAVACVATYVLAVLVLYLQLPIYSTAKATYTVGLIPCYAVIGSVGLSYLMRGRFSRAAVAAWMTCWAATAYMAYFIH
jgi:hypothetical protein